jgi:hypothetical protein
MVGERDQAARGENVELGAGPCSLRPDAMRADQPLAERACTDRGRQGAGDRRGGAVEREFADHHIGGERVMGNGAQGRHQPERDGEVVMASLLGQVGGGQIDSDAFGRHRQAGGVQRRLHPLAAFDHRLVGEADDLHADPAGRHHHLHIDGDGLDPMERDRGDARDHGFPLLPLSITLGRDKHFFKGRSRTLREQIHVVAAGRLRPVARTERMFRSPGQSLPPSPAREVAKAAHGRRPLDIGRHSGKERWQRF